MSATRIDEIADGLYRVHTPVHAAPGGFSFNQYLLVDDEPLLFHTGSRALFPQVSAAIARVLPLPRLAYVSFGHVEADECGALLPFLDAAPRARPLCGRIAAMVSGADLGPRPPRVLADDETLTLGRHTIRWLDAPHVPHGWDNGFILIDDLRALLCGDLFTQPGADHAPLVDDDILASSESMRAQMDYYAHGPDTGVALTRLAALEPRILACMHGSAWQGDGGAMLRRLRDALTGEG